MFTKYLRIGTINWSDYGAESPLRNHFIRLQSHQIHQLQSHRRKYIFRLEEKFSTKQLINENLEVIKEMNRLHLYLKQTSFDLRI